ncbi:MAG: calcium-binding protein [Pseudomonadota bacterium]
MSDVLPPELTGFTLPSTVNLGAGDATITYSAAASDAGGVSSVWITFDRPIIGSAGPTSTWLMREEFGEDFTQAPISRDLSISRFNTVGPVTVTDITVYDDAGNASSYSTTDLQALGLPTGFTIADTTPDAAPPELTGLTLPGIIDLTGADEGIETSFTVAASDDAEIEGVWLTFERPASGTNDAANRWLVYASSEEDWAAGPLSRTVLIDDATPPGDIVLFSVTVYDIAGNATVYEREDLEALDLPIGFTIVDGNVQADFDFDGGYGEDAVAISLNVQGTALAAPLIGVVLRINAPGADLATASLAVAGSLTQTAEREGDAQVLRVQADVSATVAPGEGVLTFAVPIASPSAVSVTVIGVEIAGTLAFAPAPPALFAGSPGNDSFALNGGDPRVAFGGDGQDSITGSAGADTLFGGDGADMIDGGAGQNVISGEADADQIFGGSDRDTLDGGGADDTVFGRGNADSIMGGDGNDALHGDWGDDHLLGEAGKDTIAGGPGDDLVEGNGGADTIFGDDGNDTLDGGNGANWIAGGAGRDVIFGKNAADTLRGGGGADTLDGGEGNNSLAGENGADVIVAGGGSDTLEGGAGNDTLTAGGGPDEIEGGDGDDTVAGNGGADTIFGNAGHDTLDGGNGPNTIFGGAGRDQIFGGNGNDTLNGGGGADLLDGGGGDNSLEGGNGQDDLRGGGGTDTLSGGAGDDLLSGRGGDDSLSGGDGNDDLRGDGGNDSLEGDGGDDLIAGGSGADDIRGNSGNDTLLGGNDDDALRGSGGLDSLDGGDGNDALFGGNDADTLRGGTGDDTLTGGSGDDLLDTGPGAALLKGESGRDTFRVDRDASHADILDFAPLDDTLDLSDLGLSGPGAVEAAAKDEAGALVLDFETGPEIRLAGLSVGALSSLDLVL